jgi:protein TonB
MRNNLSDYNNYNYESFSLKALAATMAAHALIALWLIFPATPPVIIKQQTIQVSFVAPSSANKTTDIFYKKNIPDAKNKNALREKKQPKPSDEIAKTVSETKNNLSGRQTSGKEDPNATATNSVQTNPIFNAAYLNNPAPFYPLSAKRRGIEGKVLLNILVKTDGTAATVKILRSSGYKELDEAALEAVRKWKFIPAHRGGQFIQANVVVPVEFKII